MTTPEPTCEAVSIATSDRCGRPATLLVTFPDKTTITACQSCALHLGQVAEGVKSQVYASPIKKEEP